MKFWKITALINKDGHTEKYVDTFKLGDKSNKYDAIQQFTRRHFEDSEILQVKELTVR